ncbi:dipeptidyl aminopeptidase/acylaminoacyl peptidase [Brevundimonas alba]|uniref:Dipeptidyl aminopeptidase/acylaminoacyl peptidase n=1 Tax=Brevundimonas alba TaxID=74314 RepID=A0A7X5YJV4_9CAUL|nr:S9 family peptidase [Brevundimonas alba]NJC40994.1 dipeptidyl aminopeptidase/acylaminoacyl peptidase [Brevundimonas alba]
MSVRNLCIAVAAASAVLFGAAGAALAQSAPIEAYAALPAIDGVSVSPDGSALAYIRRSPDGDTVVAQARTGEALVTIDVSDRAARFVFWASPDHVVISSTINDKLPYTTSPGLYEQLDIVNVRTRRVARALGSADKAILTASFGPATVGTYRGRPVMYLRTYTVENNAYTYDVYRVDLDDGRGRLHQTGAEDTSSYVIRPDGEVLARTTYDGETGAWRLLARRGGNWNELLSRRSLLDRPAILGFGRSDETVLLSEDREDGPVLVEISLADGSEVAQHDNAGADNIVRDGAGHMVGISRQGLTQSYSLFDPAHQANWDRLVQGLAGRQLFLTDTDDDLSVMVFRAEGAGEPGSTYLFDAERQSVNLIGREYPGLTAADVAEVSAVRYKAADGMDLIGYLTKPTGREARNLPLIVLPHGGPAARDKAGFDWWSQALASRGYAVFQPQFRGSEGFGQTLLEAGYGEWGRKMQSDLADGVKYLADAGMVDASRVCIVGASYGGYAALAGMTLDDGVYRCAVSVAGISDLPEFLAVERREGGRSRFNEGLRYWQRFMGVTSDVDPSLAERSPARLISRIEGPVLLIHGRDDTVVPFEQSRIMDRAMRAAGKDVELVSLAGEDHYMSFPATRRQMLTETIKFLEEHNPPR